MLQRPSQTTTTPPGPLPRPHCLTHAHCPPPSPKQVLERIKDPLKSLISREDPSTVYAALAHVLLLVQRAPFIFEADHVAFYCRTHDPWYIKKLKMEILAALASATNVYEVRGHCRQHGRRG